MQADARWVEDWLAELQGGVETPHELALDFAGCIIGVRSNSEALLDRLRDYFRGFAAEPGEPVIDVIAIEADPCEPDLELTKKMPDPGKTKIKEESAELEDGRVVRKRLTGMLFVFGGDTHLAYGPCVDNDNQVINFINNRFIQWTLRSGHLLGHAAAAALGERGLAMAGVSGRGKSTLALEVIARGADLVSNDRLMIRRDDGRLMMRGVAKMPRINPGTVLNNPALAPVMPAEDREEAEKLSEDELWTLEQKYDADIDAIFGPGRFRLEAPMTGLVLLSWQLHGGDCAIARVTLSERPDLLAGFRKDTGLFYEEGDGGRVADFTAEAYLDMIGDCPVYEVSGGVDFAAAAGACVRLLRGEGLEG